MFNMIPLPAVRVVFHMTAEALRHPLAVAGRTFESFVLQHTEGKGVHFMMADGGFSVEGKENIQEILSKQLYLCQCLVR